MDHRSGDFNVLGEQTVRKQDFDRIKYIELRIEYFSSRVHCHQQQGVVTDLVM